MPCSGGCRICEAGVCVSEEESDLEVVDNSAVVRDVALNTSNVLNNVSLDVLGPVRVLESVDAVVVLVCRCCHGSNHHCSGVS